MGEPLDRFPCLEHDDESWEMMVCVLPKEHEGPHSFVLGTELMLSLGDKGVEFTVDEVPTLA